MLCVSSCVKEAAGNNDIIEEGTEPIMFGVAVGSSETRAAAITTEYIPLDVPDFRVYSYHRAAVTEYFKDVQVTVTDVAPNEKSNPAAISTGKNWPASTTNLDFCAYYPYTTNGTVGTPAYVTASTSRSFSYTAPDNYANHDDLMLAMNTSVSYRSKVSLRFYHALTRLTFEAQKPSTWTENVTITGITISGIRNSGTVTSTGSTPHMGFVGHGKPVLYSHFFPGGDGRDYKCRGIAAFRCRYD